MFSTKLLVFSTEWVYVQIFAPLFYYIQKPTTLYNSNVYNEDLYIYFVQSSSSFSSSASHVFTLPLGSIFLPLQFLVV